jgi:hypothetical protein
MNKLCCLNLVPATLIIFFATPTEKKPYCRRGPEKKSRAPGMFHRAFYLFSVVSIYFPQSWICNKIFFQRPEMTFLKKYGNREFSSFQHCEIPGNAKQLCCISHLKPWTESTACLCNTRDPNRVFEYIRPFFYIFEYSNSTRYNLNS